MKVIKHIISTKKAFKIYFLSIILISLFLLTAPSKPSPYCRNFQYNPVKLPNFIFGASHGNYEYIKYVKEMSMEWMRPNIAWKEVMPEIPEKNLTVADVDNNPQLIIDLIKKVNWEGIDNKILTFINEGITPFTIVGHGYIESMPLYKGELLTPDAIGKENYLGYLYLYARAVVEHFNGDGEYDASNGAIIKYWQMDNELNQAYLTALWGWRIPAYEKGLNSAWRDWNFVTNILKTLYKAIKTEDPNAITTMNFHTDIPPEVNHILGTPSWEESILLWRGYMDIISMDAYPNYYSPTPVKGYVVGERVTRIKELVCGKPVMVMETGYPRGPEELGFNGNYQKEYIESAFYSAYSAGAVGFMQFGVLSTGTHTTQITEEDIENLEMVTKLFDKGRSGILLIWALKNKDYIFDHFLDVLKTVEYYWGVVGANDYYYPGYYVLKEIGKKF